MTRLPALTLQQPNATAVAMGWKPVENRGWITKARIPIRVAIHAGHGWDFDSARAPHMVEAYEAAGMSMTDIRDTPFGVVVAVVEIGAIHGRRDSCCAPWGLDVAYHWMVADPRRLTRPVPAVGRQGLWRLDEATTAAVLGRAGAVGR